MPPFLPVNGDNKYLLPELEICQYLQNLREGPPNKYREEHIITELLVPTAFFVLAQNKHTLHPPAVSFHGWSILLSLLPPSHWAFSNSSLLNESLIQNSTSTFWGRAFWLHSLTVDQGASKVQSLGLCLHPVPWLIDSFYTS